MASLVILALASIGATSFAQTPTKSLEDQLVGHWQLVWVCITNSTPYGANPQGCMFLDAGSLAGAAGRDEKRFVTFGGDELIVANQKSAGPLGAVRLTWKQANRGRSPLRHAAGATPKSTSAIARSSAG